MNNNKIDLMDLFGKSVKQDERFFSKQLVNIHELYLVGEIESPEEYIQWFDIIRHAAETDVIKIYINSPGGNVFTAIQFMRVLRSTQANIVMSVEGECASAATMIFLCGHSFEVAEHSMFMYHNYSSGLMGKGGELYDRVKHERQWSEALLRDVYKDFLTEEEIVAILENKDIWMTGGEVIERLKVKKAAIEAEQENNGNDIEEVQKTPIRRKLKSEE